MKEFSTYTQQIERLKEYGLRIDDEVAALQYLKSEGYYNLINGYSPIFKNKATNKYINGATLEHIRQLYVFDKNLRNTVYKYTAAIECNVKALIAHEFSRVHGVDEKQYLTAACFTQDQKYATGVRELITECNKTITDALNKNSNKFRKYIEHNYKAHGHVPMWVLIRALSFGTTSFIYKYMVESEKDKIAAEFGITAKQLENILEVIVSFRNIVAHGERTYCAKLPRTRLSDTLPIVKKLQIPKNSKGINKFGRCDFLALLIACKYLLPEIEFAGFINEVGLYLDKLEEHLTPPVVCSVKIQMGLQSNNWKKLPKIHI